MDAASSVKLIVSDLDGTLLDTQGQIPAGLWAAIAELRERGILFVPGSGRQYATLERQFAPAPGTPIIAENGALGIYDGKPFHVEPLSREIVEEAIYITREHADSEVSLLVCGRQAAYSDSRDEEFLARTRASYAAFEQLGDVRNFSDDVLKVAFFHPSSAQTCALPLYAGASWFSDVVVSGENWMDLMAHGVSKGRALRKLQDALRITPEQTMVFGDHLNDLDMIDAAAYSYAVANAQPEVLARARFRAPAHTENGVLQILRDVFDLR